MEQNESNGFETAAHWRARLGATDCTARERVEFAAWLAANPANEHAFRKVERFLELTALLPDERLSHPPAPPARGAAARGSRWRLPLAACAAGVAVLAWISGGQGLGPQAPQVLSNLSQSSERLTLADGSVIYLDAGSKLQVLINEEHRQMHLLSGRALFEVAHDSARPFSVRAGSSETVATGTVFQVEHLESQVQVTLASGSVTVSGGKPQSGWHESLEPGMQLYWDASQGEPRTRPVDAMLITAWTSGRHNFRDAPLYQVVEELNRYDTRKITLGDPRISGLNVGGSFVAGDNRAVVAALEIALPLRAENRGGKEIVLLPR